MKSILEKMQFVVSPQCPCGSVTSGGGKDDPRAYVRNGPIKLAKLRGEGSTIRSLYFSPRHFVKICDLEVWNDSVTVIFNLLEIKDGKGFIDGVEVTIPVMTVNGHTLRVCQGKAHTIKEKKKTTKTKTTREKVQNEKRDTKQMPRKL
jgi:hypothetical protein